MLDKTIEEIKDSIKMNVLEEIKDSIIEPQTDIADSLKKKCRKKNHNLTTGPIIKPVKFNEDGESLKQIPPNIILTKALNNTSQPQTATIAVYNLASGAAEYKKTNTMSDLALEVEKSLFFCQTVEIQPQSTVFLPVDITTVTEYEVQILDAPIGLYFSTEFLPSTPIPTAQATSISTTQDSPGSVIDSHIVTYSHQFEELVLV